MTSDRPLHSGSPARPVDDGAERGDHPAPGDHPARRGIAAGVVVTGRRPADVVTVREVAWHQLAAVALRESLAAEMLVRYSGRPQSLAGEAPAQGGGAVAYTGVVFTPEGLPVGHAALRWNDNGVELQRVYVTPPYRGSGAAAALLAAAEEAARAQYVGRIILRSSDQHPDDARFWERAGYTRVASIPRGQSAHVSQCFEKVIRSHPPVSPERAGTGSAHQPGHRCCAAKRWSQRRLLYWRGVYASLDESGVRRPMTGTWVA